MKKAIIILTCVLILAFILWMFFNKKNTREHHVILKTPTGELRGILTLPKIPGPMPVALIIAGSGLTDKNGNSALTQNDSLKILAYQLSQNHIASLRYDKRGVGESEDAGKKEQDLRFEDSINDAIGWINQLKQDKRFSKVVVIGHSQGSLIGMIAAIPHADQYISIAGVSQPAYEIIKKQLQNVSESVKILAYSILENLKNKKRVDLVPKDLYPLFRPSIQNYIISWFQYNPQVIIKQLTIPILIIQGTNDLQVSVEDAKRLAEANKKAQLLFIDKMNHIFRIINGDKQANLDSYNNPSLPISDELVKAIVNFIQKRPPGSIHQPHAFRESGVAKILRLAINAF